MIISTSWQIVQSKMKKPVHSRNVLDEDLPLRGVLKCHCGNYLTGAPSRGKSGKYFYYYKCKHSKHNNISAIKSHKQLLEIWELMSIPEKALSEIRSSAYHSIEENINDTESVASLDIKMNKAFGHKYKIGVVHGKLDSLEKELEELRQI